MSDTLIKVEGVSKKFCRSLKKSLWYGMQDLGNEVLGRRHGGNGELRPEEFWAVKDISFELKRGECLGLIGHNGAGKTTLLRMLNGLIKPDQGRIEMRGSVGALIALGAGFNPILTGRENIYVNASILGLSKREIDEMLQDIIDFSEIGDFIDAPVQSYSSGMQVRLGFAVATALAPDILIVDEALAVGDSKFQARCFSLLRRLKDNGSSIIFVSHSVDQIVSHCTRAILLNTGMILDAGEPRCVVNRYMDLVFGKVRHHQETLPEQKQEQCPEVISVGRQLLSYREDLFSTHPSYNAGEYRWGDGSAKILDFYLLTEQGEYPLAIDSNQKVKLGVSLHFLTDLLCPILGITIKTKEGVSVYGANSDTLSLESFKLMGKAGAFVHVELEFCCQLAPGDYFISLGLVSKVGEEVIPHDRRYDSIYFQVRPNPVFFGLVDLDMTITARMVS